MKKRYLLPLILVCAAALSLAACGGSNTVLDKTELTICVGAQETLTLVDKNGDAIVEGEAVEYRWESSDEAVLTVAGKGSSATVTAVAEGKAVVTVYEGNKSLAKCNVTSISSPLSVTVPEGMLVFRKGGQASVRVKSLIELTGEYEWYSSNTSIATVEYQGELAMVTAVARGECIITVRNGEYTASFKCIVGLT